MPQEGQKRTNPITGKIEVLSSDGSWTEMTFPNAQPRQTIGQGFAPGTQPGSRSRIAALMAALAQARSGQINQPGNIARETFRPSNLMGATRDIGQGIANIASRGASAINRGTRTLDQGIDRFGQDNRTGISSLAKNISGFAQKTGRGIKDFFMRPIKQDEQNMQQRQEAMQIDPLEQYKEAMITYDGRRWLRINEPDIYEQLIEQGY